jgi:hypothetical protein
MACGTETDHQPGPKVLLHMLKYKTKLIILQRGRGVGEAHPANRLYLKETDRTVTSTYRYWKGDRR